MENEHHHQHEEKPQDVSIPEVNEKIGKKRSRPRFDSSAFLPVSILVAAVLISGTILYTKNSTPGEGDLAIDEKPVNIKLGDNEHVLGQDKAKVVVVEFSDFQCPFCRSFWQNQLVQLKTDYIDTGKAKLVYKHLPLSFHPAAIPAAEASECANDQGKFWEFHDKLYQEQAKQGQSTITFSSKEIIKWATELRLNMKDFNQCFNSHKYAKRVQEDASLGGSLNVDGTPTFFINGKRIVGAQPYTAFKNLIDNEL